MKESVKNCIAVKSSSLYYFFLYCLYIMTILFLNSNRFYYYQVGSFMWCNSKNKNKNFKGHMYIKTIDSY